MREQNKKRWDDKNAAPIAVVMISLNEGHNMRDVLENLKGFASEVHLVDSYSHDDTIDIALEFGINIVQHKFENFGAQWNFALENLPIKTPWTMKLDPDERISDLMKDKIREVIKQGAVDGFYCTLQLWFMGRMLPAKQNLLRIWKTGKCTFSDVIVNEHAIIEGQTGLINGAVVEHHDSPHLHHWMEKQNHYTTAEALAAFHQTDLADQPKLFGNSLQRRMWLKHYFSKMPFRYWIMFLYCYLYMGAWRAGHVGYIWSHLRATVYKMIDYKLYELRLMGKPYTPKRTSLGKPDERIQQY